jgi:hypothetical protein
MYFPKEITINRYLSIFVAFTFLYISLSLVPYHEMWRDELQAWLLARDSISLGELLRNLKYEGHPGLWHFMLYFVSRLYETPVAMQYLHVFIATSTVFVILRWSPYSTLQKILLCFSYFFFYEYSLISRNYAIGVLLIFIICAFYPNRKTYPITIATIFFLLSHTSIFGLIFAICFFATICCEEIFIKGKNRYRIRFSTSYLIAFIIVISGITTAIIQLVPPVDSGFAPTWRVYPSLGSIQSIYSSFLGSYFPIPVVKLEFWNSNIFLSKSFLATVGFVFIIGTLYIFSKYLLTRPAAFIFYFLTSAACSLFFYTKLSGYLRHHGFLFIALVASLWIYSYSEERSASLEIKKIKYIDKKNISSLITSLFAIHLVAAFIAVTLDVRNQFSGAKSTADFLRSESLINANVIGYSAAASSAVAGYLPNKNFFYIEAKRYGTFVIWDSASVNVVNQHTLCETANKLSLDGAQVILVINRGLEKNAEGACFEKIYDSDKAIVENERFFIYRLSSNSNHRE